jgi:Tfp pilus assembly protein PilE
MYAVSRVTTLLAGPTLRFNWGMNWSMSKRNLSQCYRPNVSGGLTLVEVVVGMLVAAICLGTALQGYVAAVSIKVKAKQLDAAIAKIDADAESIREVAQASTISPASCSGNYAQTLMDKIVAADQEALSQNQGGAELQGEEEESSGSTLSLLPAVDLPQNYQLKRKMIVDPNTPNVLKVSYALTRPINNESRSPALVPAASADETETERVTVAQLSTAVMPSAALSCP